MSPFNLKSEIASVSSWSGRRLSGKVTHVIGMLIESLGPEAFLGELCYVYGKKGKKIPCEVVGFKEKKVLLMALKEMTHVTPGSEVYPTDELPQVNVSTRLLGRVLDGFGKPIDGKGEILTSTSYPLIQPAPHPLQRERIDTILPTGIKAIDALLTIGCGQRMGIFSGSGVGKTTLMAKISKESKSDINVIALIGERAREVKEFIECELGEGLAKAVVVVVTSDMPATLRIRGAYLATAIAEYFRDLGKNVVLMMDSITRFAMAQREIGLAIGEPPTHKGYPPSCFARLPGLVERAGCSDKGSITGIYTVLAEGDEINDPLIDQIRSLLDGHIVLSRELSEAGHFPPIDIGSSLSRLMRKIVTPKQTKLATALREQLQTYKEAEELIKIGGYVLGSDEKIDRALEKRKDLLAFLQQKEGEKFSFEKTLSFLERVAT